MAQQATVLAAKADDLNLSPSTYAVERPPSCPLNLHTCAVASADIYIQVN